VESSLVPLDEATKHVLTEQWLPRVRALRDQRKPITLVMMAIILVPVAVMLPIVVYLTVNNQLDILKAGVCGLVLGLPAIAFVYLGRLQSCNDVIVIIEFSVYLGDRDQIIKAISNIACFGKMQDLLRDIKPLLKNVSQ
jgi:hypothetical protein